MSYKEVRTLEVTKTPGKVGVVDKIYIRRGEANAVEIVGQMVYKGKPFDLTGYDVHFRATNAGGHTVDKVANLTEDNTAASWVADADLSLYEGYIHVAYFEFWKGDERLMSSGIPIVVLPGFDASESEKHEYDNYIDEQLANITEWLAQAQAQEDSRVTEESKRVTAEEGRVEAEQARVKAEQGRVDAENKRVEAEKGRVSAEEGRVKAEEGRVSAEEERVKAEESRAEAEEARTNAEEERDMAEQSRARAEEKRQRDTSAAVEAANSAASAAGSAASAASGVAAKLQEKLDTGDFNGRRGSLWFTGVEVTKLGGHVDGELEQDCYMNTETFDVFQFHDDSWVYQCTLTGGGGTVTATLSLVCEITSTPADGVAYKDGETVTYKITALNDGVLALYELVIATQLGELDEGGTSKTIDELRPGAKQEFTGSYTVKQADYGKKIRIHVTGVNGLVTQESDSAYIALPERNVSLKATKTVTSEPTGDNGDYYTYDTVTFDIDLQNAGNITINNVEVAEALTGCTLLDGVGYTLADGKAKITVMEPGDSVKITASYLIPESDAGKLGVINTANVTADETSTTATATGFDVSSQIRTLKITKTITNQGTGDEGKFTTGDKIEYDIDLTNEGGKEQTDVKVSETLDGAKIVAGEGYSLEEDGAAKIASMTRDQSVKVKAEYEVKESDLGKQTLMNTATVQAGTAQIPVVSPAASMDEIKRGLSVAVAITNEGTGSDQKFTTGDTINYRITVTNTGNVTLSNVTVTEMLAGATIQAGAGYSVDGAATIAELKPKAVTELTAAYTVKESDIGNKALTNSVKAASDVTENTGTSAAANIEDEHKNVTVTKTITSQPANGDTYGTGETVKFDIAVKNVGNVTLTEVKVTEETEGATIVNGDGYSVAENAATITSLAPGTTVTVKSTYGVKDADTKKEDWKNTARAVSGDVNVTGDSPTVSFKPPIPDSITNMGWNDLASIADAVGANPEAAAGLVGQEIKFSTTGLGDFTAVCVAVGHHEKADGSGKAGFTFQMKETTSGTYQMNTSNTNAGGYPETAMAKTHLPTILNAFPAELKAAIKEVKLPYNVYKGSGDGDSAFDIKETTGKLFLPSNREVWGDKPLNSNGADPGSWAHTGKDGEQFAYWVQHPTVADHKKTRTGTTSAAYWWCRSCYPGSTNFIYVNGNGYVSRNAAIGSYYVAACFCI